MHRTAQAARHAHLCCAEHGADEDLRDGAEVVADRVREGCVPVLLRPGPRVLEDQGKAQQ
jgi:hypothetical protein